jgi:hypothetical protein
VDGACLVAAHVIITFDVNNVPNPNSYQGPDRQRLFGILWCNGATLMASLPSSLGVFDW